MLRRSRKQRSTTRPAVVGVLGRRRPWLWNRAAGFRFAGLTPGVPLRPTMPLTVLQIPQGPRKLWQANVRADAKATAALPTAFTHTQSTCAYQGQRGEAQSPPAHGEAFRRSKRSTGLLSGFERGPSPGFPPAASRQTSGAQAGGFLCGKSRAKAWSLLTLEGEQQIKTCSS